MTDENAADEAWLAQLRSALVAPPADDPEAPFGHNGTVPVDRVDEPEGELPPTITPAFADDEPIPDPPGLGAVRDDLRALSIRLASVELVVEDLAHVVRRASAGPGPSDLEEMIVRILRAELPRLLEKHVVSLPATTPATVALEDETLGRWAHRAERGKVPSGDVVILANELRSRISDLEDLQRRAFEQLTADRKVLIDDAVREIRTLLFGQ